MDMMLSAWTTFINFKYVATFMLFVFSPGQPEASLAISIRWVWLLFSLVSEPLFGITNPFARMVERLESTYEIATVPAANVIPTTYLDE